MSRVVLLVAVVLALVSLVAARQGSLAPDVVADRPASAGPAVGDPGRRLQPGEGQRCQVRGQSGVCTAGACGSAKVAGACPGSAAVQCCINDAGVTPSPAPVVVPAPVTPGDKCAAAGGSCTDVRSSTCASGFRAGLCSGSSNIRCCVGPVSFGTIVPSGPVVPAPRVRPTVYRMPNYKFPYTFPYSPARHIVVDFELQRARVYEGATQVGKEMKISSGVKGIGFTPEYPATPAGKLRVSMKVGKGQPIGMIFEKLTPQKRIGREGDSHAHMQTRILVLEGLDKENKNTRSRSVYFHGTNKESLLGTKRSHGCFRLSNLDVLALFDMVEVGTEVYAVPYDAWPKA